MLDEVGVSLAGLVDHLGGMSSSFCTTFTWTEETDKGERDSTITGVEVILLPVSWALEW
jgi:hypothetical protein